MNRRNLKMSNNPLFGGPTLESRNTSGSPYRELLIADIDVDPQQPRRVFSEDALTELAGSIQEHGVLCPILVRVAEGGTFRLIAGERRLRASKLAGLERIPAIIDSSDDSDGKKLAKQLVENVQRESLSPMERALAIGQLRDQTQWSIREISKQISVSKGFVQRSLEILALPEDLQAALISGASESKILIIAKIEDKSVRAMLLARLDQLSRLQLEEEIKEILEGNVDPKLYHGGTKAQKSIVVNKSVEDERVCDEIQRSLSTKVSITRSKSKPEAGKLTLEFYSTEDLNEVYRRLVSSN